MVLIALGEADRLDEIVELVYDAYCCQRPGLLLLYDVETKAVEVEVLRLTSGGVSV